MTEEIDSPIFGLTREATDEEREAIKAFCTSLPVCVFQELNKKIRERGLMITIDVHKEVQ